MKIIFAGRIDNIKFIANIFIFTIVMLISGSIVSFLSDEYSLGYEWMLFIIFFMLIIFMISVILIIRTFVQRLHDLDRQGREIFLMLIPFYNIYLMYVFALKKGSEGLNEYGINPIDKKKSIEK